MQNMPSRPESLQEYLSHQLSFLDVKPDQLVLLQYLIEHYPNSDEARVARERLKSMGLRTD